MGLRSWGKPPPRVDPAPGLLERQPGGRARERSRFFWKAKIQPMEAARAPGQQLLPDQTWRLPEGCSWTWHGAGDWDGRDTAGVGGSPREP